MVHRAAIPRLADRRLGRRPAGTLAGPGPRWLGSGLVQAGAARPGEPRPGRTDARGRPGAAAARAGSRPAGALSGPGGGERAFGAQRPGALRQRRRALRAFGRGGARAGGRATRDGRTRGGRRPARRAAPDRRAGGGGLFAGVVDRPGARGFPRPGGGAVCRAQRRPARSADRTRGLGRAAGPRAGQRPALPLRDADVRGGGNERGRGAGGGDGDRGGSGRSGLGASDADRRDAEAPWAPARAAGEDRDGGLAEGGGADSWNASRPGTRNPTGT